MYRKHHEMKYMYNEITWLVTIILILQTSTIDELYEHYYRVIFCIQL